MLIMAIPRVLSFVFRIGFYLFSALGLFALLRPHNSTRREHVALFLATASLFLSRVMVATSFQEIIIAVIYLAAISFAYLRLAKMHPDTSTLLLIALFLSSIGIAVGFDVMRGSARFAPFEVLLDTDIEKQMAYIVVGCVLCGLAGTMYERYGHTLALNHIWCLVAAIALCMLPLIPGLGQEVNGAKAWIRLGPVQLQPAEFAKVIIVFGLAAYFSANHERLKTFNVRGIAPLAILFVLAIAVLRGLNDLGTALVIVAFASVSMILSSGKAGRRYAAVYVVLGIVAVLAVFALAYLHPDHILDRFNEWFNPSEGSHLSNIALAIDNGGIIGTGLGLGEMIRIVPEASTDSIYVAIAEELGVIGAAIVLLSYLAFVKCAASISVRLPKEGLERNLIMTTTALIVVQMFIIVGGNLRIIPLTGVTMPFVSKGGSSIMCLYALLGLCMQAGDRVVEKESKAGFTVPIFSIASGVALAACLVVTALLSASSGIKACGLTKHYITGNVMTSDNTVLARTGTDQLDIEGGQNPGRTLRRFFPLGTRAAHLLAKDSGGIETALQSRALMQEQSNPICNFFGIPETIGTTKLTLRDVVQQAAEEQLLGYCGTIVALDTHTGAILAEASNPTFNVNLATYPVLKSKEELEQLADELGYEKTSDIPIELCYYRGYELADPAAPTLNRAIKSLYVPGSTFKIVTAAAALSSGIIDENTPLNGNPFTLSTGDTIANMYDREYGEITLAQALNVSSNTAFATLALQMGDDTLKSTAESFGFNRDTGDGVLGTRASVYNAATNETALAWAAFGQPFETADTSCGPWATALQMASVMATIANNGLIAHPYYIEEGIFAYKDGRSDEQTQALDADTASRLWQALLVSSHVVDASKEVAGKTGTAESSDGNVCWYVCATADVAVACCLETQDDLGSAVAMPRALAVLNAADDLGAYGTSI